MLDNIDKEMLNRLMEDNSDASQIITQLLENHKYIVTKISHEIRNPLTLISSTLQLLENQHPELKDYKHWKQTLEDVEAMKHLLNELSTFNNSERLNLSSISAVDYFKRLALSFAASLEGSSKNSEIEFTSFIDSSLPKLTGDSTKLQEIFLNLLKNACEAVHPSGQVFFKVCRLEENCIMVSVSDTGCGIPEDQIGQIFDAFVTTKKGGTGLGLAITKRIVEAHGGSIQVSSVSGQGTTFVVRLPIEQNGRQESGS